MKKRKSTSGFTLVEVMIVVTVLALIFLVAVPQVSRIFRVGLKSATRKLVGAVRYSYDQAALNNRITRLVIDFKERKYWIETMASATEVYEESLKASRQETKEDGGTPPPSSGFSKLEGQYGEPQELPTNVLFRDIIAESDKKPITSGQGYVYFFPHGFAQPTVIHLQLEGDDEEAQNIHSLVISPLTGKVTTYHDNFNPFQ